MRLPAIAGILGTVLSGTALACAIVTRAGSGASIADEAALIVWDEKTGTQHFIRRVQFDARDRDLGFLVPTPSRPTLAEANDQLFRDLALIARPSPPRTRSERERSSGEVAVAVLSAPSPVRVLERANVAGLDAAVLAADDAEALNAWLGKNGFSSGPEIAEWLQSYVKHRWVITAFRIAKSEEGATRARTGAVRMSFKAARPFFPYREPKGASPSRGPLDLYILSATRMTGWLEGKGAWDAKTVWAGPQRLLAGTGLPDDVLGKDSWLTRITDLASSREGAGDLMFVPAGNQRHEDWTAFSQFQDRLAAMQPPPGVDRHARDQALLHFRMARQLEAEGKMNEAIRLHRRAARAGSEEAADRLAALFEKGEAGVVRDVAEARQWRELAERLRRTGNR